MDDIFLFKMISDLLSEKPPHPDKIECAKTIVDNLIKNYESKAERSESVSGLDEEAQMARNDLTR